MIQSSIIRSSLDILLDKEEKKLREEVDDRDTYAYVHSAITLCPNVIESTGVDTVSVILV